MTETHPPEPDAPDGLAPIDGFRLLHRLVPGRPPAGAAPVLADGRPSGPHSSTIPDGAHRALGATLAHVFDVLAGRRRDTVLGKLRLDDRVRAGLRTRMRAGGIDGAALRSLHPSGRVCGTRVEFIGTWAHAGRVRAFAGSMADRRQGWTITSLRLI